MPCENSARKRSKTMAFRCTPEEHKLICEMAAWSGMSRQDYIIAKLTDTQVEVRPSVSVQKALRDSMAELAKEVRLAASYGELRFWKSRFHPSSMRVPTPQASSRWDAGRA